MVPGLMVKKLVSILHVFNTLFHRPCIEDIKKKGSSADNDKKFLELNASSIPEPILG